MTDRTLLEHPKLELRFLETKADEYLKIKWSLVLLLQPP